ncbi:MAG: ABC transporter ATP-binding protein [Spirochaetes bacterium]|nr:ABC transporter ATP-binding protein [Spirochaetota bacterium]MBU1081051.1 ABC transporter ATP-binding protein [Spirochaetota bacterium]
MPIDNVFEIKNLSTSFFTRDGEVQAVRDVSFSLRRGETLGIVGESGSGKSVTFLSALGLLAASGKVKGGQALFNGRDLLASSAKELRKVRGKDIAMVFQDPMSSLNPLKTIGKQVAEALEVHTGLGRAEIRRRAIRMLEAVRIPEAAKRYDSFPHEFSGGMRQRVVIAMALICGPSLVIADEPTTALDVTIQDQILRLLRELKRESDSSIVFISHDLAVIASMCERVVVMYGGMIMEEALIGELFESPAHPYTMGLLRSIPVIDQDKGALLEPIPGSPPDMLAPPPGCPFVARCVHARAVCAVSPPPYREVSKTRRSRCWLWADDAPVEGNVFKERSAAYARA